MKHYIGIDIGAAGGMCIINEDNKIVEKIALPKIDKEIDIAGIKNILSSYDKKKIIVGFENLRAVFGSSAGSTFKFGFNCGAIESMCIVLEIPYVKVHAKNWQKEAFVGVQEIRKPSKKDKNGKERLGGLETKKMALIAAKRLYPGVDLRQSERAKNPHEGITDALLIGWFMRQKYR